MGKNYIRGPQKRAYMQANVKAKSLVGPRMPADLPEGAQRIWRAVVPHIRKGTLGLTAGDGPMLADLCLCLYRLGECEAAITRNGIIVDGRRNPALLAVQPYRQAVANLSARFGLTPLDRAKLTAPQSEVEEQSITDILFAGALSEATHEG